MWGKAIALAVGATIALTGCGTKEPAAVQKTATQTTAEVKLSDWAKNELDPALDRLGDAFTWAGGAMQSLDLTDARAAGREMDEAVDDLEATLPTGVRSVDRDMAEAVDNFRDYADGVMGLSPRTSGSEIDALTDLQDAGMAALGRVVDAVKASRS